MTARLKWVNTTLREVLRGGGRNYYGALDNKGLQGSSQLIGLLKDNCGKDSYQFDGIREIRRVDTPVLGAHKHLNDASALNEAVVSLIYRVHQGTPIDPCNFLDVLRGCCKQKNFESVKQVHDCIKKSGLEQNLYVANSLLKCYLGCGRLQNAEKLFSKLLNKNVVSWTLMIGAYAEHDLAEDAIEVYNQMRFEGGQPNARTYVTALKACASPIALKWGKDIHAHIIRDKFEADTPVSNALVHMYAKCGSLDDAKMVFDRMLVRDVISWNAMIGAFAQHGHGHEAFSLFHQMQTEGFTPNFITFLCILSAKADSKDLAWVKEVHSHATKSGLAQNMRVNTALIHTYAKCGSTDDAKLVFDNMTNRDVISWTAMIDGLAQDGRGLEAFSLFHQMQREGVSPNAATYVSILNACEGALAWVKEIHSHATRARLDGDLRVGSALVHMYAKSGSIDSARAVFDRMERRNVISWTAMIGGLAHHGFGQEAFSLFLQMQREGFVPDVTTYVSILNPSSSTGALEWVKEVHTYAMKARLDVDLRVGNALIHMYARTGSIDDARKVFDRMLDRDVVSWTVMISGLAQHGHGREALQLFGQMIEIMPVKPDVQLFLAVLSACNHSGLIDEGRFQFVSMTRDYGIEPDLEHYTCMVDALGRAGHLEEAKLFILNMPIKPDVVPWGALLGACRIYNNIKVAELAANECLMLDPSDSSPYVLLSNIYAAVGNWNQEIHRILKRVSVALNSLSEKLKAEGYIPDTRLVLHDIDDASKESAVGAHSEKLAIAYGLMHVPSGEPIRIYKNLRMCTDCHAATKFISRVTGREIVARDAKRFHLFRDGVRSCGDYW